MTFTESTNDQLMAIAMHRYCLGRRSYIVSSCIESLDLVWDQLTPETQQTIFRDTYEALERNEAGMDCDRRAWTAFLQRHPLTEAL
jgi:hypothetical protein